METSEAPGVYLGDRLAWDPKTGDLVVTDDELLDKVDRPYLSASTSKAMHSCPARMVADRSMPRGFDLFGAAELGSAAHSLLERLYQMNPGRRDKQHAMAILTEMSREAPLSDGDVDYAKAIGADPVKYNLWVAAVNHAYHGLFDIEDPTQVEVHSTEMRLDGVEVAGVPFKGFIDRIDLLPDGGLGVRDYKGLALDTPIPTPTGWTTMGALRVGDLVLGAAGRPVSVTGKSQVHHRPCYRLIFSDASSVVCDNVHLWSVTEAGTTTVLGADDLFAWFTAAPAGALSIVNAKPLDLPYAEVPVTVTAKANLLTTGMAIPAGYLRASLYQRRDLLVALMHSRGRWAPTGRAAIGSSAADAAATVAELVISLGGNPEIEPNFTVSFDVALLDPAFDLATAPVTSRRITAMVRTDSVPTQCIEVDAPDSLYLCGPLMTPTHNSGKDKSKVNLHFGDDHGDQIRLYVEALTVLLGEKPRAGSLLYITHGKNRRVALSPTEINKTKRAFAASWADLRTAVDTRRFQARKSPLCGWCPLVNSCPTAIDAGKTDKKGGAPSAVELGIPSLRPDGSRVAVLASSTWLESVPEPASAAHLSIGEEPPCQADERNNAMTNDRPWQEAKPWEGSDIDGHLSLNSFAATAVFGMSSLAAELLVKGGQKVGPGSVKALTALLASVVLDAQAVVTKGSRDWQGGSNTRLRGVLRTSLEVIALPFGQDEAAWATWVKRTHTFMVAVAATAIDLYDNGPVVDLGALATATVLVSVQDTAA